MSIEYEDLTMKYGCLDCENEWYDISHASMQSSQVLCPECDSRAVWEEDVSRRKLKKQAETNWHYDDLDFRSK